MHFTLKAGIASAALIAAAAVAAPVNAADLGRGSTKDGYVAPMPELPRTTAGPCYFRADVGYSFSRDPSVKWPVTSSTYNGDTGDGAGGPPNGIIDLDEITTTYVGDSVTNVTMDSSWLGEGGFGCGSGSRGFRGEVMLGYRGDRKIDGEPLLYTPGPVVGDPAPTVPAVPYDDPLHTSVKTYTLMFNAYKDLGNWRGITPYVGAGVGVAYNILDEVYFTGNPALTNRIEGNRDVSFAWSLMAGIGYQISDRAILDVGYRYIDMGKIASGRVDTAGFVNPAVRIDDLTAHELKVGLRFHLGQSDCCAGHVPMK